MRAFRLRDVCVGSGRETAIGSRDERSPREGDDARLAAKEQTSLHHTNERTLNNTLLWQPLYCGVEKMASFQSHKLKFRVRLPAPRLK